MTPEQIDRFFDRVAWAESLMTPEAALKYCENAIFKALMDDLRARDKTQLALLVDKDEAKRRAWTDAKGVETAALYDRIIGRLVTLEAAY